MVCPYALINAKGWLLTKRPPWTFDSTVSFCAQDNQQWRRWHSAIFECFHFCETGDTLGSYEMLETLGLTFCKSTLICLELTGILKASENFFECFMWVVEFGQEIHTSPGKPKLWILGLLGICTSFKKTCFERLLIRKAKFLPVLSTVGNESGPVFKSFALYNSPLSCCKILSCDVLRPF